MASILISASAYCYRRAHQAPWSPPGGRVVQTSSLSVRLVGDAGPPIVLLHGLVGSGLYWGGAYDRLAKVHRLVVPDLLGFGRSPRPASGYAAGDHARAVLDCLDELGIDEPVVIGAHSLGGLVALRLAATCPERVHAIVGFGPPVYPDPAAALAHVTATSPMGRLFVLPRETAEKACLWICRHRTLATHLAVLTHPALPRPIAADAIQHSWNSYSQTLQQVILGAEASAWLDQVRCPIHFVAGDLDPVVDHAYLRLLRDIHATIVLTERSGRHDLPLTHPLECGAMIEAARSGRGTAQR